MKNRIFSAGARRSTCGTVLYPKMVVMLVVLIGCVIANGQNVKQWQVFEKTLTTSNSYSNSQKYLDVSLWATFSGPGGSYTVPGFWDGGGTWRVRFAPRSVGSWSYTIDSSDSQLDNPSNDGSFNCVALTQQEIDDNPNYHGFLKLTANQRFLAYADGTPYFYLSDTLWDGNSKNMEFKNSPYDFQNFIDDRAGKHFTAMQILCADRTETSCNGPRFTGCNEDGPLFSTTSTVPNIANFQNLDQRIAYTIGKGMVVCLFPHWGPNFYKAENELRAYYRFLYGRYNCYNMIFCMSGEYDEGGFSDFGKIDRLGDYMAGINTTDHPVTIHPYGIASAMRDFRWSDWMDITGVQWWTHGGDGVGDMNWVYGDAIQSSYNVTDPKIRPAICLESNYVEQDGGRQRRIRRTGWTCMQAGSAGYTYGNHGIWNWDTQSNSGMTCAGYEASTWMKHMYDFYTSFDWQRLSPRQDLVSPHSGAAYCTAEEGYQYVVYLLETSGVNLNLSAVSGSPSVKWYNVETGQYQDAGTVSGGGTRTFNSPFGNESVLYVSTPAIAAPSNLNATVAAGPEVQLTWQDNSSNPQEDGFEIQRRPYGGQDVWSTIGQVGQGETSYTDTDGLYGMVAYRYRVGAFKN